jgi:hypothetical protein
VERHHGEPAAGRQQALGRGEPAVELAELVVDAETQRRKVRVAGSMPSLARGTAPRTISASAPVRVIGAAARARTIALETRRAWRSSPSSAIKVASSRSGSRLTRSAAVSPSRPMRMSSGPSARNEKPRDGSSSWGDDTPRSSAMPSTRAMPRVASSAAMSPKRPSIRASRSP